ncbi:MAG: hypothetical protein RLZZ165_29 [Bacteroidota bacterium]
MNTMKTVTKTTAILSLAMTLLFAAPASKAAVTDGPPNVVEMHFLKGDRVTPGSTFTAELSGGLDTEVNLVIENSEGKCFGEKQVILDQGAKLLKFRVTEIPAGIYYVKLNYNGKMQKKAFVVEHSASSSQAIAPGQ